MLHVWSTKSLMSDACIPPISRSFSSALFLSSISLTSVINFISYIFYILIFLISLISLISLRYTVFADEAGIDGKN